ncbi:MAG: RNA 3'-phosphate cyclase [Chloroflexi bacterium HGW-Chloroflexi-1]|nr:MAG: RNA 3'-phosphate cyclase [Chloroflexi bacterium HGW-Chloroflexi-1]
MIEIDGSLGEGGGQVLRSALTLAVMTGQPMRITNIRARRKKPGLQAQHLAAVNAAAAISGAEVEGAHLGASELRFQPGAVRPGDYRFDIGTAGAASLVLQTIFLPLGLAAGPSEVTIIGGTHVPWSPCFHYLDLQWLPFMHRIGFDTTLELLLAGFYPQGNGQIRARIEPIKTIAPLDLPERGGLKGIRGISAVANLDMSIAERQRKRALNRLQGRHNRIDIELLDLPARAKGTCLLLQAEFKRSSACYFGLGALGKRAEQVADEACLWLEKFLATNGAVDEYLADQLLLPLAFAEGPSEYRTAKVTPHLLTNAEIIRMFDVATIEIEDDSGKSGLVRITPGSKKP